MIELSQEVEGSNPFAPTKTGQSFPDRP